MKSQVGESGEAGSPGIGGNSREPVCASSGLIGYVLSAWDSGGTHDGQRECYCVLLQRGASGLGGQVGLAPARVPIPPMLPLRQQEEVLTLRPLRQGPQTPVQ